MTQKSFIVKHGVVVGNVTVSNTQLTVGANVTATTYDLKVSNTTANTLISNSQVKVSNGIGNTIVNPNYVQVANSTISANLGIGLLTIGTSVVNTTYAVADTLKAGNFTANTTLANAAALNVVGRVNTATFFATTSANVGANVQLTTTGALFGNSTSTISPSVSVANSTANITINPNSLVPGTNAQAVSLGTTTARMHVYANNVDVGTQLNPVSNTVGSTLGSTTARWNLTGNSVTLSGTVTATGNITGSNVNGAIGYFTGLVNATHFTTTGNVNGAIHYAGANVYANATTVRVGNSVTNTTIGNNQIYIGNTTANCLINSTAIYIGGSPVTTSAGGSNTYVQFNDSTNFGGSAGFTFNKDTNNAVISNNLTIGYQTQGSVQLVTSGTAAQELDNYLKSAYRTVEYFVSMKDNAANAYLTSKVLTIHDGGTTDAYYSTYALVYSNTVIGSFSANANTTHVRLYVTPTPAATTLNVQKVAVAI